MKTFYRTWKFGNGFGASVIRNQWSYGGQSGLYELMVLDEFGQPEYASPIGDDVVGYLTARDVVMLLRRIERLVEV